MVARTRLHGAYEAAEPFVVGWRALASRLGGRESIAGHSVEGRPLWRFDIGREDGPPLLLTALIHGLEVIGSVTLFNVLAAMADDGLSRELLAAYHLTIMPVVNPDAFSSNMDRLARGWPAARRCNRRGVDLNRNFPIVGRAATRHPFSGSRLRWSPFFRGPEPLSEPETQAVCAVARAIRPQVSLGFHSFGNLVLYPWAFSHAPNQRIGDYQALAGALARQTPRQRYKLRQAAHFYPTEGDLDDWLDAEMGTLAMTVEVGDLDRRLWHPLRFVNPFCWMNPARSEPEAAALFPGLRSLFQQALAAT